jgi:hypothetical protein
MYTVEIDISDWNNTDTVTISTEDFEKVQILQEFIEMQVEAGWTSNYVIDLLDEEEFEEEFEEDEDEPATVSTHVITSYDNNDPSSISTIVVKTEG